jgi:hypothetical protein
VVDEKTHALVVGGVGERPRLDGQLELFKTTQRSLRLARGNT